MIKRENPDFIHRAPDGLPREDAQNAVEFVRKDIGFRVAARRCFADCAYISPFASSRFRSLDESSDRPARRTGEGTSFSEDRSKGCIRGFQAPVQRRAHQGRRIPWDSGKRSGPKGVNCMGRGSSPLHESGDLLWLLPDGALPEHPASLHGIASAGIQESSRASAPTGFRHGLGGQRTTLREGRVSRNSAPMEANAENIDISFSC